MHSSILAWKNMGRGSWQAAVHGCRELDMTERLSMHTRACACAHTHTHTHTHTHYPSESDAVLQRSESEVTQSCPIICDPVNCSLPGFSIHGIFQAKVLEWVAISFSSGSSQPRDQTQVSRIVGRHFTI